MNYTTSHRHHTAFLGSHLEALATLIVSQAETALEEADIPVRSRTVSAILVIAKRKSTTIAEIADTLRQPHQLVTQRIELLLRHGIIERHPDPQDGRRKLLSLTRKGRSIHQKLEAFLEEIAKAFVDLFGEIACDLEEKVEQAREQLSRKSLIDRMARRS